MNKRYQVPVFHFFCLFCYFIVHKYIHSFSLVNTVHSSAAIRRASSPSPHRWSARWEKPPWGAEPRIELGPALQQGKALQTELRPTLSELRRTLTELRCTLNLATPHPNELRRNLAELRRILFERRRTLSELRRTLTELPVRRTPDGKLCAPSIQWAFWAEPYISEVKQP